MLVMVQRVREIPDHDEDASTIWTMMADPTQSPLPKWS
jgi:hypothetical protein